MMYPSDAAGFTHDVVFGYSRRPRFTGVVATFSGGKGRDPWEDHARALNNAIPTP